MISSNNFVVTWRAPPTAPPAPSPRATATPRPSGRLNCRIKWDASPLRTTVPILARYVFALGAMYTVPTQCHTNPAIQTSHPLQVVDERINEIKAVVKQLASRDWKKMLHKFTQRHLTGKPKSRYVEAEVARELLNHKPELHAGIADFLSECGVNHAFGKSRDELALDVLDALLEYAKIQLPEAPVATLVFNGTSNTIGAAFDESEPASTSDLSEQLAVQSGDLVLELATGLRVSFATARRALMARRFQYDKAHSDVYTALFLSDALKRDEEERFTADMQALAEAHALSESRFLYDQAREQEAQELSHQFCVSPSTARAALVEHRDLDEARHDLQSRLADDNFRRQEHFIYQESEQHRIERLQHASYQYDTILQPGDSHQGQASRFANALRHSEPAQSAACTPAWCVLQSRKRRTVLRVLSGFIIRYHHVTFFV